MIEIKNEKKFIKEWILQYQEQVNLACIYSFVSPSVARGPKSHLQLPRWSSSKVSWLGSVFTISFLQAENWSLQAFRIEVWQIYKHSFDFFLDLLLSNFWKGNELSFNYDSFDKETVKAFVDYFYGVGDDMGNLDTASTLELLRLLSQGNDWTMKETTTCIKWVLTFNAKLKSFNLEKTVK